MRISGPWIIQTKWQFLLLQSRIKNSTYHVEKWYFFFDLILLLDVDGSLCRNFDFFCSFHYVEIKVLHKRYTDIHNCQIHTNGNRNINCSICHWKKNWAMSIISWNLEHHLSKCKSVVRQLSGILLPKLFWPTVRANLF